MFSLSTKVFLVMTQMLHIQTWSEVSPCVTHTNTVTRVFLESPYYLPVKAKVKRTTMTDSWNQVTIQTLPWASMILLALHVNSPFFFFCLCTKNSSSWTQITLISWSVLWLKTHCRKQSSTCRNAFTSINLCIVVVCRETLLCANISDSILTSIRTARPAKKARR